MWQATSQNVTIRFYYVCSLCFCKFFWSLLVGYNKKIDRTPIVNALQGLYCSQSIGLRSSIML